MYFASRTQAGRMLATALTKKYSTSNCIVMALGDGAVLVGAQIAARLHCGLILLATPEVISAREPVPIGGISSSDTLFYSNSYSDGEIEELVSEYRGMNEQEKRTEMRNLKRRMDQSINLDRLRRHSVIVVSDGLRTSYPFDLAVEFLKPIAISKLIAATPFASVQAVDRMHIMADDLFCLDVIQDYISTDHYYDQQEIPDHVTVLDTIEHISLNWQQ